MKSMIRMFTIAIAALVVLSFSSETLQAQGQNGRGVGKNRVGVSYYKTPPGRQDEWLALYKKYHRPIMDYQISKGVTISSTLYAAGDHAPGQPWDFAIINISPPEGEAPKLGLTRAELIKKLFADIEDYVKGERQRWALTIDHWDESLVELDTEKEPLSLYYPIDAPPAKKK
jgi:hypothetical protein